MEALSIRDVIGPIMIGPSSSHTAGALRIAAMARRLCAAPPASVEFTLLGSFAHTLSGHGTDRALVAGMLGFSADDLRIRESFELAKEQDMQVSFRCDPEGEYRHPNTVDIRIVDAEGKELAVRGESIGGGEALITSIDGVEVSITGKITSVIVRQQDTAGVLAHIAGCIGESGVNIATVRLYREQKGARAYTVLETDQDIEPALQEAICAHPAILDVRVIPGETLGDAAVGAGGISPANSAPAQPASSAQPANNAPAAASTNVQPTADAQAASPAEALERLRELDFPSASALLAYCERTDASISGAILAREYALAEAEGHAASDATAAIDAYFETVLRVMKQAAHEPLTNPQSSMGGLLGGEAARLNSMDAANSANSTNTTNAASICDAGLSRAIIYAMATLETNASMGRIVAAPTAGASGVLPAVLLTLQECRDASDDDLKRGLATAAAVGMIVMRNATVSGAEGGCQAEIGTAAAMAAAAACDLAGGTPVQCFAAASNALTCMMGLVCDPVGGLVEVPCQKRNAAGAATALVSAQIARAGIENLIPFDETVDALYKVGRSLPFELRESALGGIAAAPSACAWCSRCSSAN